MFGMDTFLSDVSRAKLGLAGGGRYGAPVATPGPERYGRGSEATGFIPTPPSLKDTSAESIGINLGNMDALQKLYDAVSNKYVPGYDGLSESESRNIGELLNPTDFRDSLRHAAELGGHAGVTGAPITDAYNAFATHDQKLRDWQLGSQMLGGAATRGKGIMPFENFFTNPQQAYEADWMAKQLQAAPNPAEAYNLNMANASLGLRNGQRAGYGGGGGRGNQLGGGGGNMITGGSPSRVDDVVNKYSRALAPTQPPPLGVGWGMASGSGVTFTSGTVPQDVGPVYGNGLSSLPPMNPNDIYDPRYPAEGETGLPFGPWSPGYFPDNSYNPNADIMTGALDNSYDWAD